MKEQYRVLGALSFEGIADILRMVGLENTDKKKVKDFLLACGKDWELLLLVPAIRIFLPWM